MKLVCLSDTHTYGRNIFVPDGDVLIHAGDHTFNGSRSQVEKAFRWVGGLPHRHKVVIAGNHDFWCADKESALRRWLRRFYPSITYLRDSSTIIDGVKFYGSPWQPWFHDWAFNFAPGDEGRAQARHIWSKIEDDTDVLITHGPPHNIRDAIYSKVNAWDTRVGCPDLAFRIAQIRPKVHVFGHIHEGYGQQTRVWDDDLPTKTTIFVNAAICTRQYDPTNPAIVIEI